MAKILSDPSEIKRAIKLLFQLGDVIELRAPKAGKFKTISGYFDDLELLAKSTAAISGRAAGIYWILNNVNRDLLARAANKTIPYAEHATADADILHLRWLFVDCDPKRPSGISSTDKEHEAAIERTYQIRDFLRSCGWPDGIIADSGNGGHGLWLIDLPNDDVSLRLIKNTLKALDKRFSDDVVIVDLSTSTASQPCKAYGTISQKGDSTPDRPHRLSRILEAPDKIEVVPSNLLVALASEVQQKQETKAGNGQDHSFDIHGFLNEHNIEILREKDKDGIHIIELKKCVWNPDHTGGSSWVGVLSNGSPVATCKHNSCVGKSWKDFMSALGLTLEIPSASDACQKIIDRMTRENLEPCLRELAEGAKRIDPIGRQFLKESLIRKLKQLGCNAPGQWAKPVIEVEYEPERIPLVQDVELWHEPVMDCETLLNEVSDIFTQHLILPEHAADIIAVWILHTYTIDAFDISPYLTLSSPVLRCGKTTALTIVLKLARRAIPTSNISTAALYRTIEDDSPTLLIDELDRTFANPNNHEIIQILNAGYERELAFVIRCEGEKNTRRKFSTFCPKALAQIGSPPLTIFDRSIVIPMKRKTKKEKVERFIYRKIAQRLNDIQSQLARWASDHLDSLRDADPKIPQELNDREQKHYRPLFALAEAIGGSWPTKVRHAALALSEVEPEEANNVQLLSDIQEYFETERVDRAFSEDIVTYLCTLEHRPWADWKGGKPISKNKVADLLEPFHIYPWQMKIDGVGKKGYYKKHFEDAWERYISSPIEETPFRSKHRNEPFISNDLTPETESKPDVQVSISKSDLSDCKQSDSSGVSIQNGEICKEHNIPLQTVPHFGGLACPACIPYIFEGYSAFENLEFDGGGL